MKFRATLLATEAPAFFDRFLEINGPELWRKRYRVLAEQMRTNVFLHTFVMRRHGVELTIGRLLEERGSASRLLVDVTAPSDYAAFSFIASVVQIYEGLNATGKTRLAGMLRDGLNTDRGLRPLQNEIEVAAHLVQSGFDLTFHDLEGASGFDFLAVRDGAELEVECKSVSGDLGRQVHERRMADLSNRIMQGLKGRVASLLGGQLVRVTLPARLSADSGSLDAVAANVRAAVSGAALPFPEACNTEVRTFDINNSPFTIPDPMEVTVEKTRQFVNEQLGPSNVHAFVLFAPAKHALVVVVDSQKRDGVIAELVRDLKDGADQFSRQRPALLAVKFLELAPESLLELAHHDSHDRRTAPALQIATSRFFDGTERTHIHTVTYRSLGALTDTDLMGIQEQGPTYSFTNPAHPLANDARYRPFAATEPSGFTSV